jgi:hypothetical protein
VENQIESGVSEILDEIETFLNIRPVLTSHIDTAL